MMRADRLLAAGALLKLALHLVWLPGYGYFRDELYYLASTEHLAWGYVDHPPLSIALLAAVRALLGDSLWALRLVPALAGAATVWLTGWTCRRMGGGPAAQSLAMLAAATAPAYLFFHHVYSMNALDVLAWTAIAALLTAIYSDGRPWLWLAVGAVAGLGLLNKISVLWLGFGLVIGLRASRHRGWLMTPWPWAGGAIALALFAPHVGWQVARGWPTLQFMRNAALHKLEPVSPAGFLAEQPLLLGPLALAVAVAGLAWLFASAAGRRFLPIGVGFVTVLVLLMAFRTVRPVYLAAAYTALFAAGGVAIESLAWRPRWGIAAVLAAGSLALVPMALPVLPVEAYVAYAGRLGVAPATDERHAMGALPQHFADMFGWEELAAEVARVVATLEPEERATVGIFAQNYGQAGALDLFGRRLGLPPAMSGHNSYWDWGPRGAPATLVVVGGNAEDNREVCGSLTAAGRTACRHCMPYENSLTIWICRDLQVPIAELWPRLRRFI